MPPRQRPIQKFAAAVSQCSTEVIYTRNTAYITEVDTNRFLQATVYGKCIVEDYNSVHKDKCVNEFLRLKNCFLKASKKTR
ncbi:hypothetical protein F5Y13DRAFT_190951 [Hypoxylon sp. FL1857]|nr:hypothetical protein F5Y13DRAFT_190951 [Hypoxylon sp. FL1857]